VNIRFHGGHENYNIEGYCYRYYYNNYNYQDIDRPAGKDQLP